MIPFVLHQGNLTSLRPKVAGELVTSVVIMDDGTIFLSLEDFWVRINPKDNTYAVGDYEG